MNRPVDWLNYQHLMYFWMVAKSGTVGEAAQRLHLTSPTVSAQIRKLEKACGLELLQQKGRRLELTDAGRVALDYADRIFGLGDELAEALNGRFGSGGLLLRVGIVDAVPKLIVHRLLSPVLSMSTLIRLQCTEGEVEELVSRVASHQLDVVISDSLVKGGAPRRVFNHQLGESGTSFFASPELLTQKGLDPEKGEPVDSAPQPVVCDMQRYLETLPLLLPGRASAIRQRLDAHFERIGIIPRITHEFTDSALMKVFGEAGAGIFPAPTVIEARVCQQYSVTCLGRIDEVREAFFVVTAERQIRHPAVELLTRTGRQLWSTSPTDA